MIKRYLSYIVLRLQNGKAIFFVPVPAFTNGTSDDLSAVLLSQGVQGVFSLSGRDVSNGQSGIFSIGTAFEKCTRDIFDVSTAFAKYARGIFRVPAERVRRGILLFI